MSKVKKLGLFVLDAPQPSGRMSVSYESRALSFSPEFTDEVALDICGPLEIFVKSTLEHDIHTRSGGLEFLK